MMKEVDILNRKFFNAVLVCLFLIYPAILSAQSDKKYIRKGNREYEKNKFSESEILYRKAVDKNRQQPNSIFNIGDALYKQNKFEDAGKQFTENVSLNDDKTKKSAGLFNLGNSMLKANKLKESIEAYKGSLKLRPDNNEAKYNLAYAQDLLKKQEEQKQNQQNQDKNKDKNKDDQKKDQKNQKDKDDKNKDQQKDQKNNQDQKQQQQQQDQQQNISKEDAERLLNALANDEKNVQEKVKLAKAAKEKVRSVKNW